MNNSVFFVGFIIDNPVLSTKGESEYVKFKFKSIDEVFPAMFYCTAKSSVGKRILMQASVGSIWAITGKLRTVSYEKFVSVSDFEYLANEVVVSDAKIIHSPKMSGTGFKEFMENYSPESLTKRYTKKR